MGWDLPVDEFFPDRNKLMLGEGRPRDDAAPSCSSAMTRAAREGTSRNGVAVASRSSGTRSSRSRPPASYSACSGSASRSGASKEARSAAFALSIGVIFVYYILIRLGEQAGDTGLVRALARRCGAPTSCSAPAPSGSLDLNHREAAFDPLDPAHYLALPARDPAQGAGLGEARAAPRDGSGGRWWW